jgi:hypothetical protein
VAESGGLLNRCTSKIVPRVRIPPAPILIHYSMPLIVLSSSCEIKRERLEKFALAAGESLRSHDKNPQLMRVMVVLGNGLSEVKLIQHPQCGALAEALEKHRKTLLPETTPLLSEIYNKEQIFRGTTSVQELYASEERKASVQKQNIPENSLGIVVEVNHPQMMEPAKRQRFADAVCSCLIRSFPHHVKSQESIADDVRVFFSQGDPLMRVYFRKNVLPESADAEKLRNDVSAAWNEFDQLDRIPVEIKPVVMTWFGDCSVEENQRRNKKAPSLRDEAFHNNTF